MRLEGHLGAQRDGLDTILGPLGRSGRRFGVDFGAIWGSQTGPKEQFSRSGVEKCKILKSFVLNVFFMILEVRGLWKSIKMVPKSIKNGSEIDAKMMIESKIAFWRHLGHLGSHLGAPTRGRCSPSCDNMAILGPLGRPRKRFGVDFEGFGGPKRFQKSNLLDPEWKSAE